MSHLPPISSPLPHPIPDRPAKSQRVPRSKGQIGHSHTLLTGGQGQLDFVLR